MTNLPIQETTRPYSAARRRKWGGPVRVGLSRFLESGSPGFHLGAARLDVSGPAGLSDDGADAALARGAVGELDGYGVGLSRRSFEAA
ncbi:hypothetical protein GCM10009734_27600 [Nonomuraea bangladeshensis]